VSAKHSPAPWYQGQAIRDPRAGSNNVAFIGINDRNGVRIGTIGYVDVSRKQAEANLKLAIAAPALLKQVEKDAKIAHFSYCTPPDKDHAPECQIYRDLIEKATVRE
jgi:hypothetical protein